MMAPGVGAGPPVRYMAPNTSSPVSSLSQQPGGSPIPRSTATAVQQRFSSPKVKFSKM